VSASVQARAAHSRASNAPLSLAVLARHAGVQVEAEGAAVDLRGAHLHEFVQLHRQAAGVHVLLQAVHGRVGRDVVARQVDALGMGHGVLLGLKKRGPGRVRGR
jgi:hypothetical protein